MIRILQLWIFGSFLFCFGCSALTPRVLPDDKRILNIAIDAMDKKSSSCAASDTSTEDDEILNILRYRQFEVISHELVSDDEGVYHDFVLKELRLGIHIGAVVFVSNGECSGYRFTRIAQGD